MTLLSGGWYKSSTGRQSALERSSEGIRKRWPAADQYWSGAARSSIRRLSRFGRSPPPRRHHATHGESEKKHTQRRPRVLGGRDVPLALSGEDQCPDGKICWSAAHYETNGEKCRSRLVSRGSEEEHLPRSRGFGIGGAPVGSLYARRRHRRRRSWRKKSKATKERGRASRTRGGRGGGRADASGATRRIRSLKCGIGCGGGVGGVIGKCTNVGQVAGALRGK